MNFSFLNIKRPFFPLYEGLFSVRLIVSNFFEIISLSAFLISEIFLTLQIVEISLFNIRKSVSAKFSLPPKAPDFQELLFFMLIILFKAC